MSIRSLTSCVFRRQHISAFINTSIRCSSDFTNKDVKRVELSLGQKTDKMKMYFNKVRDIANLIKGGVMSVFADYWKLMKILTNVKDVEECYKYNLEELEILFQFNTEKNRLIPVMFLAALPFGNCLAVPLALKFPKKCLTHHFWTENQKFKFAEQDHQQRVSAYRRVINELDHIDAFYECPHWKEVLNTINSGLQPTPGDLMKSLPLFDEEEALFGFRNMPPTLMKSLLEMHNLNPLFNKKKHLFSRGLFILFSDYQIRRTGGPDALPLARLKHYCFLRGVNAHNMTEIELQNWLFQWLTYTEELSRRSVNLILCAPALLGINHPSNASLLLNSSQK